ncbi:LysR family transcriptional regulator [Mycobacterium sp. GA-1841]|uniref:LysR family transcriptional regulator n=1 Tax=Mycobacterium sp. GA-1841 TaxID=1834154 RepID=UPI00096E1012|nr:LysR family transcriptional regulator [Mycobacterium sp. GA-1841]OMC34541.1 LysR family transcriptional regulator [Mycobacterium sp. GA-1841]
MPLSARMPELAAFEVLLAIARTGSLGAAGRELGLTQQAVSSRLASIEAQTGVRLVQRGPRGSRLTAAGAVVAEWADQLVDVAHRVDSGLAAMRSESHSRIAVAASLTIAEQLMPRWLVSLQAEAARAGATVPQVILTAANSDQVIAAVRDGSADLGFIESPGLPRGLHSRVITHDELVTVVRPDHPWARRSASVTAAQLNDTALVSREPGSGTREALSTALRAALGPSSRQAEPAIELSSAAAMRAAVLAGAGPAVMSRLAVDDDLTLGRLTEVPVAGLDLRRQLRAIWSGGRTPPAGAVRNLLAHIASAR